MLHRLLNLAIRYLLTVLICSTLRRALLPATVSPLCFFQVPMDGKELDNNPNLWGRANSYYRRSKTQHHWRSVEAHCQPGSGSVSLAFLAIKVSHTLFITVLDLSHVQIIQHTRPTIIDAGLTLIFTMWQCSWVISFWAYRWSVHWNRHWDIQKFHDQQ